jgi:hypothetical protein
MLVRFLAYSRNKQEKSGESHVPERTLDTPATEGEVESDYKPNCGEQQRHESSYNCQPMKR